MNICGAYSDIWEISFSRKWIYSAVSCLWLWEGSPLSSWSWTRWMLWWWSWIRWRQTRCLRGWRVDNTNTFFQTILTLSNTIVGKCRDRDERPEVASLEGVQEEQGVCVATVVVCSEVYLTSWRAGCLNVRGVVHGGGYQGDQQLSVRCARCWPDCWLVREGGAAEGYTGWRETSSHLGLKENIYCIIETYFPV